VIEVGFTRVMMSQYSSQQRTKAPLPGGRGVGEGEHFALWLDVQCVTLTLPSPLKGEDWCGVIGSSVEGSL
jgi:hypothetical protein